MISSCIQQRATVRRSRFIDEENRHDSAAQLHAGVPGGLKVVRTLREHVENCGLEHLLLEPVKIRATQIDGWSRLAIPLRSEPGRCQAGQHAKSA